jgi:transposase-like protein
MKEVRRRFSLEFKLEAIRQLEAGSRLADVARAVGVNATVLRRWQGRVKVDPAMAFPGNGRVAPEGTSSSGGGRRSSSGRSGIS